MSLVAPRLVVALLLVLATVAAILTAATPAEARSRRPRKTARTTRPPPALVDPAAVARALVPPLRWRPAEAIEAAWRQVRELDGAAAQFRLWRKLGLPAQACSDLVDLREMATAAEAGFGWRDQFRGRTWARPSLARVLLRAHATLRVERPGAFVAVADLAQPGCGQPTFGTLVRLVDDANPPGAASRLWRDVRLVLGEPLVVEQRTAADFPNDVGRFQLASTPVRVEHRLLARGRSPAGQDVVRVATRRLARLALPEQPRRLDRVLRDMVAEAQRTLRRGVLLREGPVKTWDPDKGEVTRWLQHRVDVRRGRQAILVSDRRVRRGLDARHCLELRLADWHPRKPGSTVAEVRWRPLRDAEPAPPPPPQKGRKRRGRPDPALALRWERWAVLSEAGHITHDAGRDADVSFVTHGNADHLRRKPEAIDVAATWRWFEILEATARENGTPLERILIDRKIRRLLWAGLPEAARRSPLWQLLTPSPGHDAHHHVRLLPAPPEVETAALTDLRSPDETAPVPSAAAGAAADRAGAARAPEP